MKAPTTHKRSWSMVIFGLPFAAVGVGFLLLSVIPTLYDWSRMLLWEATSAEVLNANLESHTGDDSTTYRAVARYKYHYAGQHYINDRVAISTRSDNVGSFQQQLGSRLRSAFNNNRPITVWVNPNDPQESIIDRSLRVSLLIFKLVFVVIFGGVGIGLIIWGWRIKDDTVATPVDAAAPWLNYRPWAGNKIKSDKKAAVWMSAGFAAFWNAISLPIAFLVLPQELAKGNYAILIVLLFPLVGVGLAYWAFKNWVDYRRYGEIYVVLDPYPGAIGGHFGAQLDVPLRYNPQHMFYATLNCLLTEPNSGSDNETRESLVWQIEGLASVKAGVNSSLLTVRFDVPNHLPSSEFASENNYHNWRLDINSQNLSPPFVRSFTVPVYATGQKSQQLIDNAAAHPSIQASHEVAIEAVVNIEQIPGGVRLYLPYLRNAGAGFLGMLFGAIFAGAGMFAGTHGAPLIFPVVFGGLGGAIFLASFYSLTNSLWVELDQQGLRYSRRILGIPCARGQITHAQITQLIIKKSYSSQSGGKHQTVYRVQVVLNNGKNITVVDSLKSDAVANKMLETLHFLTGYPIAT